MTKEALKLALEALESKFLFIAGDGEAIDLRAKAITAIKEALAQPERCSRCGKKLGDVNHIHTCSPQRTWVGLTLDERIELAKDVDWAVGAYCEYAEKIEAALRSKND